MTDLASSRTHTNAIIAQLETAGLTVGDSDSPEAAHGWAGAVGTSNFVPYVIVYTLPGGVYDGTLANHSDDASLLWQTSCVGATRQQCEWVADQVQAALVGQPLTVAARSIQKVSFDTSGGARRDDTAAGPPVFIATPRIRVESYPA